jgi:putative ABC transport system permease protein
VSPRRGPWAACAPASPGRWRSQVSFECPLFNVGERDPLTFGAVASVLAVVALIAAMVPAIHAVRIDPVLALRRE